MLNDLEQNVEQVNFKNYGLIATTLEDVFMSYVSYSLKLYMYLSSFTFMIILQFLTFSVGSDIVSPSGETEFPDVATDSSDVPSRYEFDSTSMDSRKSITK